MKFSKLSLYCIPIFIIVLIIINFLKVNHKFGITNFQPFTVVYTYGVAGYIKPCGCSGNQQGGYAERAFQISKLKENSPLLLLDGGYLVKDGNAYDQYRIILN